MEYLYLGLLFCLGVSFVFASGAVVIANRKGTLGSRLLFFAAWAALLGACQLAPWVKDQKLWLHALLVFLVVRLSSLISVSVQGNR